MRKDKLLKEWFEFNTKYWKALKLRAKLHGHLKDSEVLPRRRLGQCSARFCAFYWEGWNHAADPSF